jgi:hypothetical protein
MVQKNGLVKYQSILKKLKQEPTGINTQDFALTFLYLQAYYLKSLAKELDNIRVFL